MKEKKSNIISFPLAERLPSSANVEVVLVDIDSVIDDQLHQTTLHDFVETYMATFVSEAAEAGYDTNTAQFQRDLDAMIQVGKATLLRTLHQSHEAHVVIDTQLSPQPHETNTNE